MAEQFADLSHHNADVDLAAYAAAGHTRVALKATEGTGWTDPEFADRWEQAGRLGLRRGAYHFARTATSGGAQADFLLKVVDAAGGMSAGDWLVLDLEDNSSSAAMARAWTFATEFAERMVARGHPDGLVYTGRWYATPAGI
ncbi:MAG TPA: glycoside hydrolase family 25 protein, partial [Mycobacteriales bacterium]